jgi:hypothetical protein
MGRSGSRRVLYAQDGQIKELRVRKQVGNAGGLSRIKTSISLEMFTRSVSYFAIRHNGKWCIYRVQAPKVREFDSEDAAAMWLLMKNNNRR